MHVPKGHREQKEERSMKLQLKLWCCAAKWIGIGLTVMAASRIACAQAIDTTSVNGTVYQANGVPGSGSLQLSWPAFTTADNHAIAAGHTSVTIGQNGSVSVSLAPNLGSTPAGLYYTAVYHMGDGTTSTEY
jgi:spore coat protein U-like protein